MTDRPLSAIATDAVRRAASTKGDEMSLIGVDPVIWGLAIEALENRMRNASMHSTQADLGRLIDVLRGQM